jgi:Tol biopolymer transport system component
MNKSALRTQIRNAWLAKPYFGGEMTRGPNFDRQAANGSLTRRIALRSITFVAALLLSACFVASRSVSAQPDATILIPGAIPSSAPSTAAPTFTPDGNTVYFGQSLGASNSSIVVSERHGNQWTLPEIAAFSGQYRDLEPAFAPSGKYLIFASNRPATANGAELDGHYNGQVFPKGGGNLWQVRFEKGAPQKPEQLPAAINSNDAVFSPAVTADGSLYFMRAENGGKFHIYRAQMKNGKFETPVLASFSNTDFGDFDSAVSPGDSYLIFCSGRPPAPKVTDLFIVFRTPSGWGDPIDLRSELSDNVHGIEARLSPDGKTLYFSNSRGPSGADVPNSRFTWQVDLSPVLKAHGIGD